LHQDLGIGITDQPTILRQVELAKHAEAKGFHSVWVAETRMVRDAVTILGAVAASTKRVRLGSAVINVWSRIAPLTALTWSTLDEMAPGRPILGLGAWWNPLASKCGINMRMVFARMREYVEVVRGLLQMQTVTLQGKTLHVEDIKLDLGRFVDQSPKKIPIFIGAVGPQLLELAGEIGDGVILDSFVSPRYNREAMKFVAKGVAKSSKSLADLRIAQMIYCSVDPDRELALKRARRAVTRFLSSRDATNNWIAATSGVPLSLVKELSQTMTQHHDREGLEVAEENVGDDVVSLLTASGTTDDCIRKVREYVASGCNLPILCIENPECEYVIDAFSEAFT
jgi:5,10-methylenetetrahydromethanopterin reductase